MGRIEAVAAVGKLMAAFRQDASEQTIAIYAEKLSDIPPEVLAATVNRVLDTSKFFPAISEIRTTAARLAGLLPATQAEALAIVRRADVSRPIYRRDGSYAYTERFWEWPEGVEPLTMETIQETLARVGEPVDGDGKLHFGWDTGFQRTYEATAEEVSRPVLADLSRARLPGPSLKLLEESAG